MSNTVIKVGLFFGAAIFIISTPTYALTPKSLTLTEDPFHYTASGFIKGHTPEKNVETEPADTSKAEVLPTIPPEQPKPVEHRVATGDTLDAIAQANQTTWKRLFNKNTNISDPNTIAVNTVVVVPLADEQLAERPLPEPVALPPSQAQFSSSGNTVTVNRGNAAGNTYSAGYCTWYAKNRRPDLPNNLGSANSWVTRAASQGLATGSSPRVGAIGQQGNHVVYIESVNADGTVTVSEMNYRGLFVISSRSAPANAFTYIY